MKKKKNPAADYLKDFFRQNPEAKEALKPEKDGSLFSPELKEALAPFAEMDVRDCVHSVDFWHALCKHAGMSDEKFEEILNSDH